MSGDITALDSKRNGLRPTWANIAVVVFFIAAVSGWFMMAGAYREKVNYLESQIILIRASVHEVEIWQRDWPSQGELMMDREQNKDLIELFRRINKLEQRAMKVEIIE